MTKMESSFSLLFLTRLLSKNCARVSHEVVKFVQKKVVLLTISMALTYPINGKGTLLQSPNPFMVPDTR